MVKIFKKGEKKPDSEREIKGERVVEELYEKKREELEKREVLSEEERTIKEKLVEEIKMIELAPELKEEAQEKASLIKNLGEEGKVKRLLNLAEEKGVVFAVETARNMKDPYLLDVFHDILAKNGLYKKFIK